jgi:hypothetical protein
MEVFKKRLVQIPNLNGFWVGDYRSNWNGGTVGFVKLEIKQTWTKITLISHNVQSRSYSRVASILTDTNKGINLVFQYENDTNRDSTDTMYNHKGYSDLVYNESEQKLEGYYTGDQINRKSAGYISYKKII